MSVIVIGRMTVDPANVAKLWADRQADFEADFEGVAGDVRGAPEFTIVEAKDGPDAF